MFRGLLMVSATAVGLITAMVFVVGLGMHRLSAAQKAFDSSWTPPSRAATLIPTTNPTGQAIQVADVQLAVPQSSSIDLWASVAILHGKLELMDKAVENAPPKVDKRGRRVDWVRPVTARIAGFHSAADWAAWSVELPKAGDYEIDASYACAKWAEGARFVIKVANQEVPWTSEAGRSEASFRVVTLGKLTLPAGKTTVTISLAPQPGNPNAKTMIRNIQLLPLFKE